MEEGEEREETIIHPDGMVGNINETTRCHHDGQEGETTECEEKKAHEDYKEEEFFIFGWFLLIMTLFVKLHFL